MLGQFTQAIANLFKFHKLKMLATFLFALVFFIAFFPEDDLSDWVAAKIMTQTGIYTQFDDMSISLIPSPGVEMENALIEVPNVPALNASTLKADVSILSALTAKLAAHAAASGLFKGDVVIDFAQGEKLKSGNRVNLINVDATTMSLEDLTTFLRRGNYLPLAIHGSANLKSNLRVDQTFEEQPSGATELSIPNLIIPSQTMMIPMNGVMAPMAFPELQLGRFVLKTRLGDGQMEIPEMNFGNAKSDLAGKIKGTVNLRLRQDPSGVVADVTNYNLNIDLTARRGFLDTPPGTALNLFMQSYAKNNTPAETQYVFNLRRNPNTGMPEPTSN